MQKLARIALAEVFGEEKKIGFKWGPTRSGKKLRYNADWAYQKFQLLLDKIHTFFKRVVGGYKNKFKIGKKRSKGSMPRQLFLALSGENARAISLAKHLGKIGGFENSIAGWGLRTAYFADEYTEKGYAALHKKIKSILENPNWEPPIDVEFLPRATFIPMNDAMTEANRNYLSVGLPDAEIFTEKQKIANMEKLLRGSKYQIEQAVLDAFGMDGYNLDDLAKMDDLPQRMRLTVFLNQAEDALVDQWHHPHMFSKEFWDVKKRRYDLPSAMVTEHKFQRVEIRKHSGKVITMDWPDLRRYR